MNKKTWICILVIVALLAASLIGCSSGSTSTSSAAAPAAGSATASTAADSEGSGKKFEGMTLRYVATSSSITADLDKAFEELTGAKVEVQSTSWSDLLPKYTTAFASESDAFDVYLMGETHVGIMGENSWYVPLNDLLTDEDREDIYPVFMDAYSWEDDLTAVPYMGMPFVMIYNEKVLSDAGMEPATTWEELAEQCIQLQESGAVQYGITWPLLTGDDMSSETWGVLLLAYGGQLFDEAGKTAFNSEAGLAALQFMVDSLYAEQWANPSSLEVEKLESLQNFCNGSNAYNINWQFMYPNAIDPEQSQVADYAKMALVPLQGGQYASWFGGTALSINPFISPEQQELAKEYIRFITSKDNAMSMAERGWIPMWRSVNETPEAQALIPDLPMLCEQIEKSTVRPVTSWYAEFNEILRQELAPAFAGTVSPQEALDSAEAAVNERIEANWA